MKKLQFGVTAYDGSFLRVADSLDDKYILLSYFVDEQDQYVIDQTITDLESIIKGEKTFEEIREDYADWTFGNNSGEFICDKDTARFIDISDDGAFSDIEMPLQELIDILYEWKDFIVK